MIVVVLLGLFSLLVNSMFSRSFKHFTILSSQDSLPPSKWLGQIMDFINSSFADFFTKFCIQHQKSCTYTPQQNARVERKHRHLLELTRALRFQAGLPLKYWGECLLAATYLVNILPTPVPSFKSPFEVLYKKLPDYLSVKSFGCLCYSSTHSDDKLAPRAIQCVFIGYPYLEKGYKLLRLDNHSIFVSRHVKFFEHIFPYHLKPRSASITSTTSSPQHTNTTSASSYTFLNWLSHNSLAPNVVVDIPSTSTEFQDTSHISDSDIHNSPLQSIYETASDIHNS